MGEISRSMVLSAVLLLVLSPTLAMGQAEGPISVISRQGTGPHDITLFLHNVTDTEVSKTIPGSGSAWNWFDTDATFNDHNTTLTASGTNNRFDWFMYPAFAENTTVSSVILKIWAKAGLGSSQNANINLEVYERNTGGDEVLVDSNNAGSQTFPAVGTLWSWDVAINGNHTFAKGSTLKVRLTANPGTSKTIYFYYDSLAANSRIVVRTADHITVEDIVTYDMQGVERTSFPLDLPDKRIEIRAQITDPFGGYDVKWANLSIERSGGGFVVRDVPMTRISGTPISFSTIFNYTLDYSSFSNGRYNITIDSLDHSGYNHYHHFMYYDYGEYPVAAEGFLYIGGLPLELWVEVDDDHGSPLQGALVKAGEEWDGTDQSGLAMLMIYPGAYQVSVYWQDVRVYEGMVNMVQNVTRADPLVIKAAVFSPIIRIMDHAGEPLQKATLLVTHPNGSKLDLLTTDAGGNITLQRTPLGVHGIEASWRGVPIYDDILNILDEGPFTISGSVFRLTVTTVDPEGNPLSNIGISASEADSGFILDFKLTGADGKAVLRVPTSILDISAYWMNIDVGGLESLTFIGNTQVQIVCFLATVPVMIVDSRGFGLGGAMVVFKTIPGGETFAGGKTDELGNVDIRVVKGTFEVEVIWGDTYVASEVVDIVGANLITIRANVLYVEFDPVDIEGARVSDCLIEVRSGNGVIVSSGNGNLTNPCVLRLPAGEFALTVIWKGVIVNSSSFTVYADEKVTIEVDVYPVNFMVQDNKRIPLSEATVSAMLDNGWFAGNGFTDDSGQFEMRLPKGEIEYEVVWKGIGVFLGTDSIMARSSIIAIASVYYVPFKAFDSKGEALTEAAIKAADKNGEVFAVGITEGSGACELRLPATTMDITVVWLGVSVCAQEVEVIGPAPVDLPCQVYQVILTVLDSVNDIVIGAALTVTVTDSTTMSMITDMNGTGTMRIPLGDYRVTVSWKGVPVLGTILKVTGDASVSLHADVHYLTVLVRDDLGAPVGSAWVGLSSAIHDTAMTDESGKAVLRLPGGTYDIDVHWLDRYVGSMAEIEVSNSMEVDFVAKVHYLTVQAMGNDGKPLTSADVTVKGGTIIMSLKTQQDGTAIFRLPEGSYTVESSFRTTEYFKGIEETHVQEVSLNSSMEISVRFTSYPASFFTAPLFYASILPLVFFVTVTSVLAIIIWRKGGEVPESPPEPDTEGGLEEEELDGIPDDIVPPMEPEPGQV